MTTVLVKEGIVRLKVKWNRHKQSDKNQIESARELLSDGRFKQLDLYDQIILAGVKDACLTSERLLINIPHKNLIYLAS